jgi:hypothetical protein
MLPEEDYKLTPNRKSFMCVNSCTGELHTYKFPEIDFYGGNYTPIIRITDRINQKPRRNKMKDIIEAANRILAVQVANQMGCDHQLMRWCPMSDIHMMQKHCHRVQADKTRKAVIMKSSIGGGEAEIALFVNKVAG